MTTTQHDAAGRLSRPRLLRLRDAVLALLGGGVYVAGAVFTDHWPPHGVVETAYVLLPPALAVLAAVVLAVRGDSRALVAACGAAWFMVVFTMPAYLLGLAFVPGAALLSVPFLLRSRARTA